MSIVAGILMYILCQCAFAMLALKQDDNDEEVPTWFMFMAAILLPGATLGAFLDTTDEEF